jgi:flagellar hook-length control protein FliK
MTNLPITSNALQPAANNAMAGTGTDEIQFAGPFAALLAQQIGDAESALLNIAQISIDAQTVNGGTELGAGDTQNRTAIAADTGIPADAASSIVASMLLQLPQEPRTAAAGDNANDASPAGIKADPAKTGISLVTSDSGLRSRNTIQQEVSAAASTSMADKTDMAAIPAGQQVMAESRDMAEQFELPAIAQSTQPASAVMAQSAPTPALSSVMPNMPASNNVADTPQTIATPVGHKGWADEFSQKISWMSTQQDQVAELHLNPPDLGPLDVVLKITDNQATALFTSPHGAVREAVENSLPKLREALAESGITLGNATVSDQPPRERNPDDSRGQDAGISNQRDRNVAEASSLAASTHQSVVSRNHGLVDTFV